MWADYEQEVKEMEGKSYPKLEEMLPKGRRKGRPGDRKHLRGDR